MAKRSLFLICWVWLSGCIDSGEKVQQFSGRTMGTTYSVKFLAKDESVVTKLQKRVEADLKEVNRQMSTYIKDSEISNLNRTQAGTAVRIGHWFAETLQVSLELAKLSGGRFDPTIGPLVNLWGFGPKKSTTPPTEAEIKKVKSYVGFDKLSLKKKDENWWVEKSKDKVYVDLSASAKGFGVDVISRALIEMGHANHLVEIGGELRGNGTKNGTPWRVAIEKPDANQRAVQRVIQLKDKSLATSGSYRNFFMSGGKSYSHMLDRETGKPVQHKLISASVIDRNCVRADALATALMAMGPEKAIEFSEKNQIAAYLIIGESEGDQLKPRVHETDRFRELGRIR